MDPWRGGRVALVEQNPRPDRVRGARHCQAARRGVEVAAGASVQVHVYVLVLSVRQCCDALHRPETHAEATGTGEPTSLAGATSRQRSLLGDLTRSEPSPACSSFQPSEAVTVAACRSTRAALLGSTRSGAALPAAVGASASGRRSALSRPIVGTATEARRGALWQLLLRAAGPPASVSRAATM